MCQVHLSCTLQLGLSGTLTHISVSLVLSSSVRHACDLAFLALGKKFHISCSSPCSPATPGPPPSQQLWCNHIHLVVSNLVLRMGLPGLVNKQYRNPTEAQTSDEHIFYLCSVAKPTPTPELNISNTRREAGALLTNQLLTVLGAEKRRDWVGAEVLVSESRAAFLILLWSPLVVVMVIINCQRAGGSVM